MAQDDDRENTHQVPAAALPEDSPRQARTLSPAAERALAEAAVRRAERARHAEEQRPEELRGRGGLDPTRYGDWEVKGIASDF